MMQGGSKSGKKETMKERI